MLLEWTIGRRWKGLRSSRRNGNRRGLATVEAQKPPQYGAKRHGGLADFRAGCPISMQKQGVNGQKRKGEPPEVISVEGPLGQGTKGGVRIESTRGSALESSARW